MLRNLKLTIAYDGTDFLGWQVQPQGRTVQEVLESAVAEILQTRIRTNVCGRTDTGVHALGQVVNFYTTTTIPCEALVKAFNAKLPDDVSVLDVADVGQSFCANKDAISKRYRYVFLDRRVPDPFLRRFSWHTRLPLDADAMHSAAQALRGRLDFRSFQSDYPNRLTSVRTIRDIAVTRVGETVVLEVEADGFLYNMVRTIAGTLYLVGRGQRPASYAGDAQTALDRAAAGPTAPAHGLTMVRANYPEGAACRPS
jgi:tRNA pseudouridine38-40 synthase